MEKKQDKRVEVYIPKGFAGEEPNLYVSINGINYLLPRGKTSLVPVEVKAEIDRARKAQELADANSSAMEAQ